MALRCFLFVTKYRFLFSLLLYQIIGYFMGLVPRNVDSIVKLKDNVTDSEKWISKTDIDGSPACKLELSLSRPIILMPRSTNSLE